MTPLSIPRDRIVCTQQDFAVTGVEVERDGEPSQDRRRKHSGKGRAKDAADAVTAVVEADAAHPCRRRGPSRSFSNYGAVDPSLSW